MMGVTKRKEQLRINVNISGEAVKQVRSFRYLGSLVDEDGRCDAEIRSRIGMAKTNFWKNEKDTDKQKFEYWDPAKNFDDLYKVSDVVRL